MDSFEIDGVTVGGEEPFFIMGPCVIESEELVLEVAERLVELKEKTGAQIIFKSSFDKANRSAVDSYRGPGLEEGLRILQRVGREFEFPVLTDIHRPEQASPAAEVVDALQIPAFLCRQTDLVVAAARTGLPVNIKKGQFVAPWNMEGILGKARHVGNENLMVTERGTVFGYNRWVVDMRNLVIMREAGGAVIYDATHSIQLPGAEGDKSGGSQEFILPQARAAMAVGIDGVFMETHPDTDGALCDGPNMLPLDRAETAINQLLEIHRTCGIYREDRIFEVNEDEF